MLEELYKTLDLNLKLNYNTAIVMVGLPGSGKSTISNKIKNKYNCTYLSSDKIREELYGDENCQDNPSKVFSIMNSRFIESCKNNKITIYDATNLNRKRRTELLNSIPSNVYRVAVIVWSSIETCIDRDSLRNRTVGKKVIDKMVRRFETPTEIEGFNGVIIVNNGTQYQKSNFNTYIEHDSPYHKGTLQDHIESIIRQITEDEEVFQSNDEYIYLKLASYHDIGKPYVKSFVNNKGEVTDIAHYYNHENVGAYIVLGMYGLDDKVFLSYLVNIHMTPFNNKKYYNEVISQYPTIKEIIDRFHKYDINGD